MTYKTICGRTMSNYYGRCMFDGCCKRPLLNTILNILRIINIFKRIRR